MSLWLTWRLHLYHLGLFLPDDLGSREFITLSIYNDASTCNPLCGVEHERVRSRNESCQISSTLHIGINDGECSGRKIFTPTPLLMQHTSEGTQNVREPKRREEKRREEKRREEKRREEKRREEKRREEKRREEKRREEFVRKE
ncbi:unnamed protein product [Leuciscus chuanchicus]